MTNEVYLIVSYFAVGLLSFWIALAATLWLRRSFTGVVRPVPGQHFGRILRKVFSVGLILPALWGFFSVSFHSCSKETYDQIIADRAYLIEKNQEQLSAALSSVVIALLVWGLVVVGALIIISRHRKEEVRSENCVSRTEN